jgi:chemotaxis protein methyltransferase CheR
MTPKRHTLDFVRRLVFERSGIVLDGDKGYLVEARLAPLAREAGLPGIDELVDRLRTGTPSRLEEQVVEALLTSETSFFRDPQVFERLAHDVIPRMLADRPAKQALRIWSAACSSGQEPYSMAMLFHERFSDALGRWTVRVTASDLSTKMLDRARRGSYSRMEVRRGLSDQQLRRHFQAAGNSFQISDQLKGMLDFRQINLVRPWPALPPIDLVLLRNVLIYMDAPTRRQVLDRLRPVLRSGGYVILGSAEATFNAGATFEAVDLGGLRCLRLRE